MSSGRVSSFCQLTVLPLHLKIVIYCLAKKIQRTKFCFAMGSSLEYEKMNGKTNRLLVIIMDGVGYCEKQAGNAVLAAPTPSLAFLRKHGVFTTLKAHGTWVGLPFDKDLGNSEVGHNTIGAGRVVEQGATLVNSALHDGSLFTGKTWKSLITNVCEHNSTLHFIGLLSDGNVHAHQEHLHHLLTQAKIAKVRRVRVHALLDGRDVAAKSAEIYIERLQQHLSTLASDTFDAQIASCGGRMQITMDRYEANWEIVKRGWDMHVLGRARKFSSAVAGISALRQETGESDQFLPPFMIDTSSNTIVSGDSVVFYNFRGDRAIQVSQAFTDADFSKFKREKFPDIFYVGMMEYDSDRKIPAHFLLEPPRIKDTVSEHLVNKGIRQFACSESQKFGHVTFFWNGNQSDYFDPKLEEYLEIPSDKDLRFERKPWMQALEITNATISRIENNSFDFARINFANGDMVGHTGDFNASVVAVATIDLMLGRIVGACRQHGVKLIVTADHGNCDEMFADADNTPKTSHTLNPVPFYFYDPQCPAHRYKLSTDKCMSLANVANTILSAMGMETYGNFRSAVLAQQT